jgi:hypothetical protein|tara:strand:- start:1511 stop:1696 length:186 start_codon:yes stop_codon:yes gene_type:complete
MNDEKKLLIKVLNCLIDTAQNATDLDNVYSSGAWDSVSWAEVYKAKEYLLEESKDGTRDSK